MQMCAAAPGLSSSLPVTPCCHTVSFLFPFSVSRSRAVLFLFLSLEQRSPTQHSGQSIPHPVHLQKPRPGLSLQETLEPPTPPTPPTSPGFFPSLLLSLPFQCANTVYLLVVLFITSLFPSDCIRSLQAGDMAQLYYTDLVCAKALILYQHFLPLPKSFV